MKRMTRLLCLLLALVLLVGCAPSGDNTESTASPEPSGEVLVTEPMEPVKTQQALEEIKLLGESPDDNYRTFYEIFVYSFCDSNGDGIGDLQGVISKLDYLQELGIRGIWLMPIHPSTSYHKYNVTDYYAIDPDYGTMADFEQLIAECEKRDIHLIIDLVVNHTGSENPWFKEAVAYLQNLPAGQEPDAGECKYLDYYFFSKESAGNASRPVEGTDWYYEGAFDFSMPDLNLGNQAVRDEIQAIMQFWIDKGVAGFRLDAAKEFYSGSTTKNVEVLSWIQHLCGTLGMLYDSPDVADIAGAESIRPDALGLCYPVAVSWGRTHKGSFQNLTGSDDPAVWQKYSLDTLVREDMPPVFLWTTRDDQTVPCRNSLVLAQALEEKGVEFVLHVYRQGRHGLGVANALVYPASQIPPTSWDLPGWLEALARFFYDCGLKIED